MPYRTNNYEREELPLNFFNQTALNGENNKRLYSARPTNSEGTAAWSEDSEVIPRSKVEIPAVADVEEAKDWVDNGSRL